MSSIHIYGPSPVLGSDNRYHYVYRITNLIEQKNYYGSRTSKINPFDDLGTKYFSSACANSWIIEDQKQNPQNYKYKILKTFATRKDAVEFECVLHEKFDVGNSDLFYNASKQTSSKFHFSIINKVFVKVPDGKNILIDKSDLRYTTGEFQQVTKGTMFIHNTKDKTNARIDKNLPIPEGWESGRIIKENHNIGRHVKGTVNVKNSEGITRNISVNSPEYLSGEWFPIATNQVVVRDECGNTKRVYLDNPDYISGKLISNVTGYGNPRFKHYKKTPWGIFDSSRALEPEIQHSTLNYWCGKANNNKMLASTYNRCKKLQETFGPECIGKTFKELGFSLLTPEEYHKLQNQ